jgi:uncharacterized protein involved in outer membrane biogenesis
MKALLKWIGIGSGLLVGGLAIVPSFIRVDQFRPEIVKAVNQELNGTLELGKLDLSLWGRVRIAIDGLKVTDLAKKEVLSVKDASFEIPFTSLFAGSPSITFQMKEPTIQVVKDTAGKINLLSLPKGLKITEGSMPVSQAQATPSPAAPSESVKLPGPGVECPLRTFDHRCEAHLRRPKNLSIEYGRTSECPGPGPVSVP